MPEREKMFAVAPDAPDAPIRVALRQKASRLTEALNRTSADEVERWRE